jgi:hypothetical protein
MLLKEGKRALSSKRKKILSCFVCESAEDWKWENLFATSKHMSEYWSRMRKVRKHWKKMFKNLTNLNETKVIESFKNLKVKLCNFEDVCDEKITLAFTYKNAKV